VNAQVTRIPPRRAIRAGPGHFRFGFNDACRKEVIHMRRYGVELRLRVRIGRARGSRSPDISGRRANAAARIREVRPRDVCGCPAQRHASANRPEHSLGRLAHRL